MLPNPIVVSDEEIKEGDLYLNGNGVFKCSNKESGTCELAVNSLAKYNKKVMAGIPELPSIDFSALSDEDCKRIGWIDIKKISDKVDMVSTLRDERIFTQGFKTAQSLNDKKLTEEDMLYLAKNLSREMFFYTGSNIIEKSVDITIKILQQLKQPKVFDIEATLENNSIKITKIV